MIHGEFIAKAVPVAETDIIAFTAEKTPVDIQYFSVEAVFFRIIGFKPGIQEIVGPTRENVTGFSCFEEVIVFGFKSYEGAYIPEIFQLAVHIDIEIGI